MKVLQSADHTASDKVVIPNYLTGFQNGINVPDNVMGQVVYAGHPVYKKDGKYLLVPLSANKESYEAVEGVEYVGVVKASRQTDEHFSTTLAVMDMGVVETAAMPIKYSDALLKELKSNLKIAFR